MAWNTSGAPGEHVEHPVTRRASTARVAGHRPDVPVQVTARRSRAGQRARAQREADALPAPRLQQPRRVPGDQHPAVAQRRFLRSAPGQVAGVVLRPATRSAPAGRRSPAGTRRVRSPSPRPAITPTVSRSPLGKTQAYDPGIGPQSSSSRPRHRSCSTSAGTGISSSRPRSTWRYRPLRAGRSPRRSRPPRSPPAPRRFGTVGQPDAYPLGVLLDRADRDPLAAPGAGGDRRRAQPVVELLAAHHRHQPACSLPAGELPSAVAGERHPVHLVVRGHLDPAADSGQRGADQAAAAGLVARVLGPLTVQASETPARAAACAADSPAGPAPTTTSPK